MKALTMTSLPRAHVTAPAVAGVALAFFASVAPAAALTALDVCPADADPCDVTQVVEVSHGALLDFGFRAVRVRGFGRFDFGVNSGTIRCGTFDAETDKAAIDAAGTNEDGSSDSGLVRIQAVRSCSDGDPLPCVDEQSCQLGACDARRCSGRTSRLCTSDANCQLGECGPNRRCSASANFVRCNTNADCDYGSCPAQLSCQGSPLQVVECSSNTDCDRGSCSIGDGSLAMDGAIDGASDRPASIILSAAADVSVTKPVNLSSSNDEADGGELEIQSGGSVSIAARVRATSGRYAQGGLLEVAAAEDITIEDRINVGGGDFDGGSIELYADRDIRVNGHVLADSKAGAGFGGEIIMDAGQDLILNENPDAGRIRISTSGHTNAENFAGDGGDQDYFAERDLIVGANVRFIGRGSKPDGYAMVFSVDAGRDLVFRGDIVASAAGAQGEGGYVGLASDGSIRVDETSKLALAGARLDGEESGLLEITSGGNIEFAGRTTAQTGAVDLYSYDGDVTVAGDLLAHFGVRAEACRITLLDGSRIRTVLGGGDTRLEVRESMDLQAGSEVTTAGGPMRFVYRTEEKPPVLNGTISPAPELIVNPSLGCPVCGNSEIDYGETCDDGNDVAGDGCDDLCLLE